MACLFYYFLNLISNIFAYSYLDLCFQGLLFNSKLFPVQFVSGFESDFELILSLFLSSLIPAVMKRVDVPLDLKVFTGKCWLRHAINKSLNASSLL